MHGGFEALDLRIVEVEAVTAVSRGQGIEDRFLKVVEVALAAVGRPGVDGDPDVAFERTYPRRQNDARDAELVGPAFGADVEIAPTESPVMVHRRRPRQIERGHDDLLSCSPHADSRAMTHRIRIPIHQITGTAMPLPMLR